MCVTNFRAISLLEGQPFMPLFKALSIRYKILIIPVVSILLFSFYLWISLSSTFKNVERVGSIRDTHFPLLELATANQNLVEKIKTTLDTAVVVGEADDIDLINPIVVNINANFKKLKQLSSGSSGQINQTEQLFNAYLIIAKKVSTQVIEGSGAADASTMNRTLRALTSNLDNFQKSSVQHFNNTIIDVNEDSQSSLQFGIVIAVLTVAILIFVAIVIASMVVENVRGVVYSLKDIAQGDGDLTKRISSNSQDELGTLIHWFNTFVEKLQTTIKQVVETADPMSNVSKDLLEITNITEHSIQNQLHDCQEVNMAMNEMKETVNHIVQSAAAAASAANGADNAAKQSQDIVNTSVASINDLAVGIENAADVIKKLEQDSSEVGEVLDVIKSIADQTNLLALNAAIEAARAGEHGRGFAVVADEVRALASKTHQSTETIQNTINQLQNAAQQAVSVIGESQVHAQQSVTQISRTGDALDEITRSVSTINDMNNLIASATEEQQNTLVGIVTTTDKITSNAQDSSQQVERLIEISKSVEVLSNKLHGVTKQFIV
jgi:methyl-accepting chemotaxis protein